MRLKFLFTAIFTFVLIVFLNTCTTLPQNNDNVPPTILIKSPLKDHFYHGKLNIGIEIHEVYEEGKSISQLDRAIVKIVSYHDGSTIYSKEFKMSGYQYEIKDDVNLPAIYSAIHSSCTMIVEAYDVNGNRSEGSVNFYISDHPLFFVYITSPPWIYITNVTEIELMGGISISPEHYGDVSNVYVMISNSSGYFSNSLGSSSSFYFYTNLSNLEESNWIYVYALSTYNYWTNSWIYYIYDTNKPFVKVLDPSNNQTIPTYYDIVVSNYDYYYIASNSLVVVDKDGNTNIYLPYLWSPSGIHYEVNFAVGTNEIIAYAKDEAGNENFDSIRIIADDTIPYVVVSNSSPSYVGDSNFTTYGYSSVGGGYVITNIMLLVYTNSSVVYSTNISSSSGNVPFSILHPVFMGTNSVGVIAYANNGKAATNYYTVIADYIKPFVNFILTNNEFVSSDTNEYFNLVLEVGDTNYSWGAYVYIYVTNYPSGSTYYSSFWTSGGITTNTISTNLIRGKNDIYVFCIDHFGNSSSTNLTNVYFFDNSVYVAHDGNDSNHGTIYDPLKSVQLGLNKAYSLGATKVKIKSGTYTPGNGLNSSGVGVVVSNSISIIGGFNSDFSSTSGLSVFDGQNLLDHVIVITNTTNTTTLENLEITGGSNRINSYPHNHGGGILAVGLRELLVMSNVIVRNNYSPFGGGIGIVNSSNTLFLVFPIKVHNNISSNGGGIAFSSSTNNCIPLGEAYVFSNTSIYGGGISIISSSVSLSNVNVELNFSEFGGGVFITNSRNNKISIDVYWNVATNSGGGIYLVGSISNTLVGNIFSNKTINNDGGGLYLSNVLYNTIIGNVYQNISTGNGAGIYLNSSTNNTINANVYSNRVVGLWYGGGIYLDNSYGNTINGNVYANSAGWLSGGIYLNSSSSNIISANVYNNYGNDSGGGIYLNFSSSNIISGNIYSNFATNGGGIYLYNSGHNMISGYVYGNRAHNSGGGIYLDSSSFNTISGSVYSNMVNYGFGGGIEIIHTKSNILSGDVYGNYAIWGGGVSLRNSTNNILSNNIFNNWAGLAGGGVFLKGSLGTDFTHVKIFSNTAQYGGGIQVEKTTNETITGIIYGNKANLRGGGIHVEYSSNVSIAGQIYSNFANLNGGGINITNSHFYISGNVSYNISSNLGGGISLDLHSRGILENVFLTNNVSSNLGGAIYISNGSGMIEIKNSIFSGNWGKNHGGAIYGVNTTNLTIQSNVFTNNYSSSTNTVITIASSISNSGSPFKSLKFITNIFSGYGANSCAIWEEDLVYTNTLFDNDIKNHTIVDNVFYTNTFTYLYRDINTNSSPSPKLPGYIYSNEVDVFNTGDFSRHDASPSSGNVGY